MKSPLVFGILSLLTNSLIAQQPAPAEPTPAAEPGVVGLSPDETSALLQRIAKVGDEFDTTKKELLTNALTRIRNASASEGAAVEFYLACYKLLNIDRVPVVPGEKAPDPNDTSWRDSILDGMKETNIPAALRVQLAALALAIEASQTEDREALLPRLRALVKDALLVLQMPKDAEEAKAKRVVATVGERKGEKGDKGSRDERDKRRPGPRGGRGNDAEGILSQSAMGSIFARAYNLHSYIERSDSWPNAPLELEAVYEQTLIPVTRGSKKAELPSLWDEYISAVAALHRVSDDEVEFLVWGQTQGKNLQWKKQMDLLRSGVNAAAASEELLKLIKENPTQTSIGAWVKELTDFASKVKEGGIDLTAPQ